MKKTITFISRRAAVLLLMMMLTTAQTAWAWDGLGTQESPYQISSTDDLDLLAERVNSGTGDPDDARGYKDKYFVLTKDLDYSQKGNVNNYTPIGYARGVDRHPFWGHFDGQGHTISGIRINQSGDSQGLFGYIKGAEVKNVTLANARITGNNSTGGIVGWNHGGTITNCHVLSDVTIATGESDASFHGGIVGQNYDGPVSGCTSAASITSYGNSHGGVVGWNYGTSARVSDCLYLGSTVEGTYNVGAIVGYNEGEGTVENCYFTSTTITSAVGSNTGTVAATVGLARTVAAGTGVTIDAIALTGTATDYRVITGMTGDNIITAYSGGGIAYAGNRYYGNGCTVSLTLSNAGEAPAGYMFAGAYTASAGTLSGETNPYTLTMPDADVTISAVIAPDPDHFSVSGDEYTIKTPSGWGVFCDLIADGESFSGKTVKLGNNIGTAQDPITRMAGSDDHRFMGTFDGQGNTLTVSYVNTDNNTMTAPFSYVDAATIRNLVVGGSITGSAYRAAGIIGETSENLSHITNCVSSVDISSGRYTGGISIGGKVAIEGCVFNGKIVGTQYSGGFVGWSYNGLAITNCLFAPQDGSSISGGTFYYNGGGGDITPTNSYYTTALGTPQGKQAHSITAGENVTVTNAGTPETVYTVSGITSYGTGIKYGSNLYAGSGDEVSLTLSHGDREGYTFDGYTASAGTLSGDANPYTLTMPDENVTIGATFTKTPVTTSYVDASGTLHENVIAIPLDNTMTTISAGWYVVNSDVTFSGDLFTNADGEVHIILCDGATLTANNITPIGHSDHLCIYGQSQGTGTANISGGILATSSLQIYGGTINAAGSIACAQSGVVIYGGNVTAAGIDGFRGLTFTGGTITAGTLQLSEKGSIILGGATVKANSYNVKNGNVTILTGITYYDGTGASYTAGNLSAADISAIAGKTLTPAIVLADNADNTSAIATAATLCTGGKTIAVQLSGRTLYKDGAWNTLCLPFDVSTTSGPLSGDNVKAMVLDGDDSGLSGTTLTLNFDNAPATIPAGTPFIIKWDNTGENITNPVFNGVTIDKTNRDVAFTGGWFKGTYEKMAFAEENKSILFVGDDNNLHWPLADASLGACRAYFELSDVEPGGGGGEAPELRIVLNFGEEEKTGISSLTPDPSPNGEGSEYWYSIDGRKLQCMPTQKGLYIVNGKKVVIK